MTEASKSKNFSYYFPTPEYLLISNSGLAVSDEGVKFVQFRQGLLSSNLELAQHEQISLSEGVVQAGYIQDPDKLGLVLKDLSSRYGIRHVYATLPEERAYLFTAVIDRVPTEGLRDAVAFILEENVPLSLSDAVFDFDIVEDLPESKTMKLIVSVLSKKVVDFYIQVFESSGITPVSFDIESQAIARALVPKGEMKTQMIINLEKHKTGFYVVEDEVVQFTTTLPYAGTASSPHLNDLKTEMRKVLTFWSARSTKSGLPPRAIEKILLCGRGSLDKAFVTALMADCSVPHTSANPWTNVSHGKGELPKDLLESQLDYVSAIGLALPHLHR